MLVFSGLVRFVSVVWLVVPVIVVLPVGCLVPVRRRLLGVLCVMLFLVRGGPGDGGDQNDDDGECEGDLGPARAVTARSWSDLLRRHLGRVGESEVGLGLGVVGEERIHVDDSATGGRTAGRDSGRDVGKRVKRRSDVLAKFINFSSDDQACSLSLRWGGHPSSMRTI